MLEQASNLENSAYIGKRRKKNANMWAGRLAWLGHLLDVQKVAGPNPARPTINSYFLLIQRYV
jgi:hypothetical protein